MGIQQYPAGANLDAGFYQLANGPTGFRNVLINGDMSVWQRGTSASAASLVTNGFTADRWQLAKGGLANTDALVTQVAGTEGFRYAARVERKSGTSDTTAIWFHQSIETVNSIPLQGKYLTLSFYLKFSSSFSGPGVSYYVVTGTGTDNSLVTGFTGQSTLFSGTVTPAGVGLPKWIRYTFTSSAAVANSATQVGVLFNHYAPSGSASGDYYEITGVQLEPGIVATPFDYRPFQQELALCQRYYYRLTADNSYAIDIPGMAYTASDSFVCHRFPVPMRTPPVATETDGTAAHYAVRMPNTGSQVCDAVPGHNAASRESATMTFTTAVNNWTAGFHAAGLLVGAGTYLGWSAEL